MDELVSIIIPAYNAEKTIERCIESTLKQSYENVEIILIDDGSIDNTLQIVMKMAQKDARLKVIHQDNQGASSARNKGIAVSTGEYLMFVDSDDWIKSDCVYDALVSAQKHQADIVLWNAIISKDNNYIENTPLKDELRVFKGKTINELLAKTLAYENENPEMLNISITGPVCKLYKRSIVGDSYFPDEIDLGEDLCFLLEVSSKVEKILYIKKYNYVIEISDTSLSQKPDLHFSKRKKDFVNLVILINKRLHIVNDDTISKFIYRNYLTVVEKYLFLTSNISFFQKRKLIDEFITGVNIKINYSVIRHKCKFFLRTKLFLPLYLVGHLSVRYKDRKCC